MNGYLGIDTSNYTTSAAIYCVDSGEMISERLLLPVPGGERGLMQSKAVFEHIRQLPVVMEAAFSRFSGGSIRTVCYSSTPRAVQGSYMPVFLAGQAAARSVAASHRVRCHTTSHQVGHILAALKSAGRTELISERFIAFHLSGGTTEALLVTPDEGEIIRCECIASSLDLKAGQAIDRIGVMLGLDFPCGAQLDRLSQTARLDKPPVPTLRGLNCCLSGLQNICEKMYKKGEPHELIARYAIEYIYETVAEMSRRIHAEYGPLPTVYAGGVMSNTIISSRLSAAGGIFCEPQYSSDNATGVAYAAYLKEERICNG